MQWEQPLIKGRLVKRYKRFFADVEIDGEVVTAHCPNTGSLRSCLFEGGDVYVTPASNPERKLRYTLEVTVCPKGTWIGVNTARPNMIVKELIESRANPQWKDFSGWRGEVAISKETRFDFGLTRKNLEPVKGKKVAGVYDSFDHYIEVKNVTLKEEDGALFPDSESTRGQKHLVELTKFIDQGKSAEVIFTVQRNDVKWFSPAAHLDPKYAELLKKGMKKGLIVSPYLVDLNLDGINVSLRKLPIREF